MPALARAVSGRARVARTLVAWVRAGAHLGGLAIRPASVNGQPGAVLADEAGRPAAVWALDVAGGRIRGVSSVVNPSKLTHLRPVAGPGRA